MSTYRVQAVPLLQDNYGYLLVDESSKQAAAVDPAEPAKMLAAAKEAGVTLACVLTTHKHWDHAGGNAGMAKALQGVPIYGGGKDIQAVTHVVAHGDRIKVSSLSIRVHSVPCHTRDHVLYQVESADASKQPNAVFTGDTLFIGGCGRFFEGTAQEMYRNLVEEIADNIDLDTLVYCGHEYTVRNLEFAASIEPDNKDIMDKLAWARAQRAAGLPTVPSSVRDERAYNPFVRCREASVIASVAAKDALDAMQKLRARKDKF